MNEACPSPRRSVLGLLLISAAVTVPACALSDDYFVDPDAGEPQGGSGSHGDSNRGGKSSGGGSAGSSGGGSSSSGQGGSSGSAGSGGSSGASAGGTAGVCTDCPTGCDPMVYAGKAYLFCTVVSTYSNAEEACAGEGMTLAVIDDAEEDEWVWTTIDDKYFGTQPFAFIGASDRDEEGEWVFADGEQFWSGDETGSRVGGRYVNWDADQPNGISPLTGTQEDCGSITLSNGGWNDARCDLLSPFVCEQN